MCVFFTPNRFALRLNTQKKAIGKPTTSLPFTCKSVSVTLGLASHSDARPFSMPTHTPIPSRRNRLRLATLLAMTALGIAALPRAAEAFFCFSFQMGGGPRYSMWAPSSPFGPWYGPTVDYPGYPGGLGYPGRPGGGYGGFPTPYGSPWSGWGNPWRGLGGAPQAYSPYGFGSPGYGPMGSGGPLAITVASLSLANFAVANHARAGRLSLRTSRYAIWRLAAGDFAYDRRRLVRAFAEEARTVSIDFQIGQPRPLPTSHLGSNQRSAGPS